MDRRNSDTPNQSRVPRVLPPIVKTATSNKSKPLCQSKISTPNTSLKSIQCGTSSSQKIDYSSLDNTRESQTQPLTTSAQLLCPMCFTMESSSDSLRQHIQKKHFDEQTSAKCPHCPKVYIRNDDLRRHILVSNKAFSTHPFPKTSIMPAVRNYVHISIY